jgi:hypothetical protein
MEPKDQERIEFQEYIYTSRNEFSQFITLLEWNPEIRVKAENILIAYDQLTERLTISNTQREGYREELEAQVKLSNELSQGLQIMGFKLSESEADLKRKESEFHNYQDQIKQVNLWNLELHEALRKRDERIKELKVLVKEAWEASRDNMSHCGTSDCEHCNKFFPNHKDKEEWLKSKGIN